MQTKSFQINVSKFSCLFLFLAGSLWAGDMSKGVVAAFRNQLVISKDALPVGKNEKETIAKIKVLQLGAITGESQENVQQWTFSYTAFLKSNGANALKLEFQTTDAKPVVVATQHLNGIDPKSEVLSGTLSISTADGIKKGKTYKLNLIDSKRSVVAKAQLTFK